MLSSTTLQSLICIVYCICIVFCSALYKCLLLFIYYNKVFIYVYLQFKSEFNDNYLASTSLNLPLSRIKTVCVGGDFCFTEYTDTDECSADPNTCHFDATCTNTAGSFTCACNDGFVGDGVASCGGKAIAEIVNILLFPRHVYCMWYKKLANCSQFPKRFPSTHPPLHNQSMLARHVRIYMDCKLGNTTLVFLKSFA